ncbi:MAG: LysR family transcriptional regulator [Saccharothrix sp.]|nr:LysR family transcriptional regulator [Saccharothrix sp.]
MVLVVDLDAVRTFIVAADVGQFQDAAVELSITQQAVSKRIAVLEKEVGVRLFTRTPRGAVLTIDGQAFLPHARDMVRAEERALAAVRPDRRALRVDVIGRSLAPAGLLRAFHRAHPDVELVVLRLADLDTALAAIRSGTIDASFRLADRSPSDVVATPVLDEPIQLLTGPRHALAGHRAVAPEDLAPHRIWMPGLVAGTEWAAHYARFAAAFGLTIDTVGPHYGTSPLLDVVADSPDIATLVGERTRLLWPGDYDLRRIPLHRPTPVYPHSLLHLRDNPHPGLTLLREHLVSGQSSPGGDLWR